MMRWLRRKEALPLSSKEISDALRQAAKLSDDAAQRTEYTAAADALDRGTALASKHGDAPTRDELQYALGRAELGLKDQLGELIEIVKGDRLDFQGLQQGVDTSIAAMRAMEGAFSQIDESLAEWREEQRRQGERVQVLEDRADVAADERAAIRERLDSHDVEMASFRRSRDDSIEERRRHAKLLAENERRYAEIKAQLAELLSRPAGKE
jgi:chromosome segregation ATPase